MTRVTPMVLAPLFACAILSGFVIANAELGLAGTMLVGFAAIGVLVIAGLALELLLHGPSSRVRLSRG